jgi:hypothetical protein
LPRQAEHRVLAGPLDRRISQTLDANPARQSTFDGCAHEIGREEGQRYRHIDLTYAAPFAFGDAVDISCCIIDKFLEPTASARDRGD